MNNVWKNVNSFTELKEFANLASQAGFCFDVEKTHAHKIKQIIKKYNKFNIPVPETISNPFRFTNITYIAFEKICENFFSHNISDVLKIKASAIHINPTHKSYPKTKTIEELMKMGYTASDNFNPSYSWSAYDLSNPKIIRFMGKSDDFNALLRIINGPELPYYSEYTKPSVSETDDFKIHSNLKVQFKNPEIANKLRDLIFEIYKSYPQNLIKL